MCSQRAFIRSTLTGSMIGARYNGLRLSTHSSSVRSPWLTSSSPDRSASTNGRISRCKYGSSAESRTGTVRQSSTNRPFTDFLWAHSWRRLRPFRSDGSSGKNSLYRSSNGFFPPPIDRNNARRSKK